MIFCLKRLNKERTGAILLFSPKRYDFCSIVGLCFDVYHTPIYRPEVRIKSKLVDYRKKKKNHNLSYFGFFVLPFADIPVHVGKPLYQANRLFECEIMKVVFTVSFYSSRQQHIL